ncbi:MAG: hypothetical protein M3387_07605 [Actinomycetota bacterium]|nr:hypothetical protein [Actinomycetota bacterium]
MSTLEARRRRLQEGPGRPDLVVAFSGGVDSSYLLAAAVDVLGDRVTAATAVSPSLPAAELAQARSSPSPTISATIGPASGQLPSGAWSHPWPTRV